MLLRIPENRAAIIDYLKEVSEDAFIDEFVLPFFNSFGFQVYRINVHGPGEHGKDIIFSRFVTHLLDVEYTVVQAKAEYVRASNVNKIAQQINRALKVPFISKSGQGQILPSTAFYINARRHSNDANDELPSLIDLPQFVRIQTQENVCDLILNAGIGPRHLIAQLSHSDSNSMNSEDKLVYNVLMKNAPSSVDRLLDHQLQLIRYKVSHRLQEMVIDAIYLRWKEDQSWSGTVKPMKWFDTYFGFFTERQYTYFLDIFKELTSSTRTYRAEPYTRSVITKTSPINWATQAKNFIHACAEVSINIGSKNKRFALEKLQELSASNLVSEKKLKSLMSKTIKLMKMDRGDEGYDKLRDKIDEIAYPTRIRRRRTKRLTRR